MKPKHRFALRPLLTAFLLASCTTPPSSPSAAQVPAPSEGKTRITIQRTDEIVAASITARVRVDGQLKAELARGESFWIDLPAGRHVLAIDHRPGSASSILDKEFSAGMNYTLRLELDPARFPPYDGLARPFLFLKQSWSAESDNFRSLFVIRSQGAPQAVRSSADMTAAMSELERAGDAAPQTRP